MKHVTVICTSGERIEYDNLDKIEFYSSAIGNSCVSLFPDVSTRVLVLNIDTIAGYVLHPDTGD